MNHEDLKKAVENRKASQKWASQNFASEAKSDSELKQAQREVIECDVERFIASGGKIQQVGSTQHKQPEPTFSLTRKRWTD